MKNYQVTLVFNNDEAINFNCETVEDVQKQIKDIYFCYNNDLIKVIQVLNLDLLN